MKLGELLKEIREFLRDWGFFLVAASLLNYAIFAGMVYKKSTVEDGLKPYVEYFEDAAKAYGVKLNMNNLFVDFVDKYPVSTWVGLCESGKGVSRYITIRRDYFKRASAEIKYALVIHELGHCVLDRDHVEGYLPDKCPKSIMHPSDGLFGCFFKNQDYYFRELFGLL
jgi:hypothetical protein